jgi:L-asparaginase
MRHVVLITTGGTIEKTYDESTGTLDNRRSVVGRMLRRLRLDDVSISINELMSKDSLLLTDDDRMRIVATVRIAAGSVPAPSGIIITHGTDTLSITGETLVAELNPVPLPIVLTGAMRPYEMKHSDALQNITEAILATGVLAPGVYCVAHSKALAFPGVVKDRVRRTFVRA